jgi:hypothetical protein
MGVSSHLLVFLAGVFAGVYLCRTRPTFAQQLEDVRKKGLKIVKDEVKKVMPDDD